MRPLSQAEGGNPYLFGAGFRPRDECLQHLELAWMVVKGVLEALIFLHNEGVSHNHLFDSTVFMDNNGTIRCTDFSLIPNLLELVGAQKSNKGDLPALGALTESLLPTPPYEMRQFIEK